jgi:hypothetical protein
MILNLSVYHFHVRNLFKKLIFEKKMKIKETKSLVSIVIIKEEIRDKY